MRILIAEGDRLRGEAMVAGLKRNGLGAEWVPDSFAAWTALRARKFSALALDHGLPKLAGIDLLCRLRSSKSTLPVLMIIDPGTGVAQAEASRGEDNAVPNLARPFDISELAARLRALVFGAGGVAPMVEYGALQLDPILLCVKYEERSVELSAREFALLYELIRHVGKVLTRAQLQSRLYDCDDEIGSNTLEVYVHNLRRKIAPSLIRTMRGVGYVVPKLAVAQVAEPAC